MREALDFLERLAGYSDERPDTIIHSSTPGAKQDTMWRKGYFACVILAASVAVEDGEITDKETINAINNFNTKYTSAEFGAQPVIKKRDVHQIKTLMRKILGGKDRPH